MRTKNSYICVVLFCSWWLRSFSSDRPGAHTRPCYPRSPEFTVCNLNYGALVHFNRLKTCLTILEVIVQDWQVFKRKVLNMTILEWLGKRGKRQREDTYHDIPSVRDEVPDLGDPELLDLSREGQIVTQVGNLQVNTFEKCTSCQNSHTTNVSAYDFWSTNIIRILFYFFF